MSDVWAPQNKIVLVVDDDPFVTAVYSAKLKRAGFQAESAVDGTEALRRLDIVRPQLVLLDLNMPRLSGIEVLKYIRQSPALADIPVIVLSNACTDEVVRETWAAKPTRFFVKRETSPNTVIREVEALLKQAPQAQAAEPAPPAAVVAARSEETPESWTSFVMERLRAVVTVAHTPDQLPEAVLSLYQSIQPQVRQVRAEPVGRFATFLTEELVELLEVLYSEPWGATPSAVRALTMGIERFTALFASGGPLPGARFSSALTLIAAPDEPSRKALFQILGPPVFTSIRVKDERSLLALLEENAFEAIVLDEFPEPQWLKRIRAAPGGRDSALMFLVPHEDYRPTLVATHARVSKPVLATDLRLKLLVLIEHHRSILGTTQHP